MKFGYARVSTKQQNLDSQIQQLEAAGCDRIFSEKVSGAKIIRHELDRLLDMLREGDTIVITSLDRLGRRMLQLTEMVADFKERGIHLIALNNNINTSTPMGMLMFNICAAFAEMEREVIRERVVAGMKAAKKNGRESGRPTSITPQKAKQIEILRKSGEYSVLEICELVGTSRASYYRWVEKQRQSTVHANSTK